MNTNRLKGLIVEKGYTQIGFCDKIGVSITVLKNCLKKGKTDTETLRKMCKVLEVSSSTILNF
jgi:DNA-binding Xre family transcriptional regulator